MADAVSGNSTGPNILFDLLYENAGGLFESKSDALLPTVRGIKYQRSLLRSNLNLETDPVAEFIKYGLHECNFVRSYQLLPSVTAVIAADNEINDIINFCTEASDFTILTLDTTYIMFVRVYYM